MEPTTKQGPTPGAGTPDWMAAKHEGAPVEAPVYDLVTWQAIEAFTKMDAKTLRRAVQKHGFPVCKVLGQVRAKSSDINAWLVRMGCPVGSASGPSLRLVTATG